LPDTQQTVLRLARDVEVSNRLYTELLNTAQQLRVSKAGTVGDVRIIDTAAVARKPVGAKPVAILGIALLLGVLLSMVIIWLLRSLRVVVEDPEIIESQLGLPVYATVPHSKTELDLHRKARGGVGELLAVGFPQDDAVESLRGLRTTLHFALLDAKRNSLLITGSSPGLGKSFISKNLGVVLAQVDKRVVIVDADLRRGHMHKEFGRERAVGVSEYVAGQASLDDDSEDDHGAQAVGGHDRPDSAQSFRVADARALCHLLSELGERFDTVIVDAPPVLAVSDAAIIGRHVGATLMVARSGKHPIRELEQAVKRLNQAGVRSRASSSTTSMSAARITATVTRATSTATRTRPRRWRRAGLFAGRSLAGTPPPRLVEADAGGDRDVEAGDRAEHRDADQLVAGFPGQAAQAVAFGTEHPGAGDWPLAHRDRPWRRHRCRPPRFPVPSVRAGCGRDW
jgi:tyrosine-protein kinase Etk/Wzc